MRTRPLTRHGENITAETAEPCILEKSGRPFARFFPKLHMDEAKKADWRKGWYGGMIGGICWLPIMAVAGFYFGDHVVAWFHLGIFLLMAAMIAILSRSITNRRISPRNAYSGYATLLAAAMSGLILAMRAYGHTEWTEHMQKSPLWHVPVIILVFGFGFRFNWPAAIDENLDGSERNPPGAPDGPPDGS